VCTHDLFSHCEFAHPEQHFCLHCATTQQHAHTTTITQDTYCKPCACGVQGSFLLVVTGWTWFQFGRHDPENALGRTMLPFTSVHAGKGSISTLIDLNEKECNSLGRHCWLPLSSSDCPKLRGCARHHHMRFIDFGFCFAVLVEVNALCVFCLVGVTGLPTIPSTFRLARQSTTSLVSPLPYPCMMGQRTRRR